MKIEWTKPALLTRYSFPRSAWERRVFYIIINLPEAIEKNLRAKYHMDKPLSCLSHFRLLCTYPCGYYRYYYRHNCSSRGTERRAPT
ncbi:MAG TPA: hypothetical protein VI387_05870 [Candidatus Brocadiales bacterium]|nr:hypothetical protein [Candidatus Brocadiales bacterium]